MVWDAVGYPGRGGARGVIAVIGKAKSHRGDAETQRTPRDRLGYPWDAFM